MDFYSNSVVWDDFDTSIASYVLVFIIAYRKVLCSKSVDINSDTASSNLLQGLQKSDNSGSHA